MKDFKGIYGEQEKDITYYEHGAHFKYSDLVNALNRLQSKPLPKKDLQLRDELNNANDVKIIGEKKKKKKYKLKLNTEANNDNNDNNNRYKDLDSDYKVEPYPNEEKKNDNEKFTYHLKKSKVINAISKSVDRSKINLPKIVYNHINNNSNSNNIHNPLSLRNKSFNTKELKTLIKDSQIKEDKKYKNEENSKEDILPKLDSNYYNQDLKEKEYKKTIDNIKMFSIKNKNKRSYNFNNNNDRMNTENGKSKSKFFLNNRIRSIFEIEKEIKKNYLNNELSNNYSNNKNYIDVINNDISNQIYQLKKNLLINNSNKKENSKI